MGVEQSLLDRILRPVVREDAAGRPHQRPAMTTHQRLERVVAPLSGQLSQPLVALQAKQ
jgi:hypothetical protein